MSADKYLSGILSAGKILRCRPAAGKSTITAMPENVPSVPQIFFCNFAYDSAWLPARR
jgi:hypothetical protein